MLGGPDVSIGTESEEVDGAFAVSFFQFLSAANERLSVPAGKSSSAPVPLVELDGAAVEAAAIFGLGIGTGFGGGGGVGLGDDGSF